MSFMCGFQRPGHQASRARLGPLEGPSCGGLTVTASHCPPHRHPPAVPSRPFRIHLPTDCLEGAVPSLNTLVRISYQSNCTPVLNGSASVCLLWALISLSSKAALIQRLDPGQSRGSANQGPILRSNALINALLKKLISSTMFPLRNFSTLLSCKVLMRWFNCGRYLLLSDFAHCSVFPSKCMLGQYGRK